MPKATQESNSELEAKSRFVVGIDLGTTNCAFSFVDTLEAEWRVETFRIPQWIDFGQLESRETLPSFHYTLTSGEAAACGGLPWTNSDRGNTSQSSVGVLARDAGPTPSGTTNLIGKELAFP